MPICSVTACEKTNYAARGMCWRHYRHTLRYGEPENFQIFRGTLAERVEHYTDRNGPVPEYDPALGQCWVWIGTLTKEGYGSLSVNNRQRGAHRVVWELHNGPIPSGLTLDHLCRVRRCVNPNHLEPVTSSVNALRSPILQAAKNKTHCVQGHPRTPENTYWIRGTRPRRLCKLCLRAAAARAHAKARVRASTT